MIDSKDSIFILSICDFLETQDMDSVFKFLDSIEKGTVKTVFPISKVGDIRVKTSMNAIKDYAKNICETKYAKTMGIEFEKSVWIREPELVKWEPGAALASHVDGPGRLPPPNLTVGALVYLNDNYEGGELYFPEYDVLIKPKAGDLVFFPCHFYHEVKTVGFNGEFPYRYTLPLFYTYSYKEIK